MACTLHIGYEFSWKNLNMDIYRLRHYSKSGIWKMKITFDVGCKGSCPDPEVPCPPILLTEKKELTLDLSDKMSDELLEALDDLVDDYNEYDDFSVQQGVEAKFKTLMQNVGGPNSRHFPKCNKSPECDWLGKTSPQDLMVEYADETVDKLKAKAKFANLCDCDVTTTTVLTTKVLKYAVDEVEKDLFVSRNP